MDFGKRIRNRQYPPERCGYCLLLLSHYGHIFKHVFDKDAVARGGVADENVRDKIIVFEKEKANIKDGITISMIPSFRLWIVSNNKSPDPLQ